MSDRFEDIRPQAESAASQLLSIPADGVDISEVLAAALTFALLLQANGRRGLAPLLSEVYDKAIGTDPNALVDQIPLASTPEETEQITDALKVLLENGIYPPELV